MAAPITKKTPSYELEASFGFEGIPLAMSLDGHRQFTGCGGTGQDSQDVKPHF